MKKITVVLFVILLFSISCRAVEPDYIGEISDAIPGEISEIIGDETTYDGNFGDDIDFGLFFNMIVRALASAVPSATKSLAAVIGLLIISSVLGALREAVYSKTLGDAVEFLSALCVCASAFSMTSAVFSVAEGFINGLSAFLEVLLPIMTAIGVASGSITFAASSAAVVSAAVALLGMVCTSFAFPLLKVCFSISIASAMCGSVNLSGISTAIKKLITYIMSVSGIILVAVLTFQTIITKSADTAAIKGVKFTVGTLIPLVGSALGDAMTTISGSVGVVRATVGVAGAVILCAMVILPTANLLINKVFLDISGGVADLLGLKKEREFLAQMSGVVGFLAAITAFIGVFFIIAVSVIAATGVNV